MTLTVQVTLPAALAETLSVVDAVLASVARHVPVHVSREDLASAGKVALVEALLRFDGEPAAARAFCFVRVRGAIWDELRRLDPLSRHTRAQVSAVRRTSATLERALGRAPTVAELSGATGYSPAALAQLERLAGVAEPCSADETGPDGEPIHLLVDTEAAGPARTAEQEDAHASLQAALDRLAPVHAHVVRRYYLEEATLEEIASELQLSKERVRQVRDAAGKKLRANFTVLALWQSMLSPR